MRKMTPQEALMATAFTTLAGKDGFRRHTHDRIHGYKMGYLVAVGVPGTLGRTYPFPEARAFAELK
jgi:hypothetical protein